MVKSFFKPPVCAVYSLKQSYKGLFDYFNNNLYLNYQCEKVWWMFTNSYLCSNVTSNVNIHWRLVCAKQEIIILYKSFQVLSAYGSLIDARIECLCSAIPSLQAFWHDPNPLLLCFINTLTPKIRIHQNRIRTG